MKDQRQIKVHERRKSRWDPSVPEIQLKGQWLSHFGFAADEYVDVKCEERRITITPRAEH